MNVRVALNIGLALAVAAIAGAWYLAPWRPNQRAPETYPVVAVPLETVRKIEIQRRAQQAIVLERNNQQWQMTAPVRARLDEVPLGRVLDVARLRAATRIPAQELERFELERPWAQIRFDQHAVDFGMVNEMTRELYLRSGDNVYTVLQGVAAAVPVNAVKLLAHRLFGADERPLAFNLNRFRLHHDGTRWQLDPPDPGLSQDDLVRWVEQWRHASSTATQPSTGSAYAETISIELKGAGNIVIGVAARTPDLVLVRLDEGLQYHLPSQFAQSLLAHPSETPARPR